MTQQPKRRLRYDPANDLYAVLDVQPSATLDDLRRSFRQRAKEVHPDLNPDKTNWAHEQFQRLNDAYDILRVLAGEAPTVPIPDFEDAYQTQRVLEAALISAVERRPGPMEEVQ